MPTWLFALACPIGMGLMMLFMMRGMRGQHQGSKEAHEEHKSPEEKLARLEAEKQGLERQIASRNNAEKGPILQPQDK